MKILSKAFCPGDAVAVGSQILLVLSHRQPGLWYRVLVLQTGRRPEVRKYFDITLGDFFRNHSKNILRYAGRST
jgi:hypothetical protein